MCREIAIEPAAAIEHGVAISIDGTAKPAEAPMVKPDLLKSHNGQGDAPDNIIPDHKKGAETITKPALVIFEGIATVSIDGKLTANSQMGPDSTEDLGELDDIDLETLADAHEVSTNVTPVVPTNLIFDTKVSSLNNADDSSWADDFSGSQDEDFDVPFTEIFDD